MRLKDWEKYDDFYVAARRMRQLKENDPYLLIAGAALANRKHITYGRWVQIVVKRGKVYIKPTSSQYGIYG